jgi:uncharacterized damage-inducible protein DinB
MDPRVFPLAEIYRLNTRLVHNCLDGLTEEQGRARPVAAANSAAFIAAHVADTRFAIVAWLGAPLENPLSATLADARGIDDIAELPTLAEIRAAWDVVSGALEGRLALLSAEELDAPSPQRFPAGGPTLLGALSFLAQHDSYHVGQLALLRKAAGLPAMRYSARPPAGAT